MDINLNLPVDTKIQFMLFTEGSSLLQRPCRQASRATVAKPREQMARGGCQGVGLLNSLAAYGGQKPQHKSSEITGL